MLSSTAGVSLGTLFVAIAGTNVWLMLRATRPSQSSEGRACLLRLHRLGGYLFLALFSVMFFYMNLRVLGVRHGLPIAITVHSALAFLLVPLLLVKVLIARHHKQYAGALLALGLAIFALSFLLVSITSFPVLWASVTVENVPLGVCIGIIAFLAVVFGTLFLRRPAVAPSAAAGHRITTATQAAQTPGMLSLPEASKSLPLLLSRIQEQTHNTKTLRFLLPQGNGFHFRPGQFLTFNWIVDGKAIARSYSICSSPSQKGHLEITVKRVEGGCVSVFLNRHAHLGLTVEARGPSGQFCFDESQHKKIVLIAGGSGITPMMGMLRYIDDIGLATDVTLIYFVRTPKDIIFAKELTELRASIRNFHYLVVAGAPDPAWKGPSGHLSQELLEDNVSGLRSSTFFLCGPRCLMESARNILHSLEIPDAQILQESFGEKPSSLMPDPKKIAGTLVFARSRRRCSILDGRTVLETAEANGIFIPSSCRRGQCGTCAVRALGGVVRMETEDGLTPDQKKSGYILACVGRPKGTVTLDS